MIRIPERRYQNESRTVASVTASCFTSPNPTRMTTNPAMVASERDSPSKIPRYGRDDGDDVGDQIYLDRVVALQQTEVDRVRRRRGDDCEVAQRNHHPRFEEASEMWRFAPGRTRPVHQECAEYHPPTGRGGAVVRGRRAPEEHATQRDARRGADDQQFPERAGERVRRVGSDDQHHASEADEQSEDRERRHPIFGEQAAREAGRQHRGQAVEHRRDPAGRVLLADEE